MTLAHRGGLGWVHLLPTSAGIGDDEIDKNWTDADVIYSNTIE